MLNRQRKSPNKGFERNFFAASYANWIAEFDQRELNVMLQVQCYMQIKSSLTVGVFEFAGAGRF